MLNAREIMELQKLAGMDKFSKRTIAEELERQKVVELILSTNVGMCIGNRMKAEEVADRLIANDVVPVVRCKDCIWFSKNGHEDENSHKEDVTLHYGHCGTWRQETQACRFCSDGERKDND